MISATVNWIRWFEKTPLGITIDACGKAMLCFVFAMVAMLARGNPAAAPADGVLWALQWVMLANAALEGTFGLFSVLVVLASFVAEPG